jgi:hypothetical protein
MNTMPFIYALVPASGLLIYIASVRRHVIGEQLQKRRVQQLSRQILVFQIQILQK